jgi:phosphatidylglycerophosphate synthase
MAARMPAFVMPDHLTILGLVGSAITGACYAATDWSPVFLVGASIGLFINWVGDSLDGTLARYRGTERPRYGFFVDHTSDIFSQMVISFGLGLSAYMRFDIACLVLIAYLMVSVFTYIRMQAIKVLQVSYGGFGPTELRLIMLAGNLLAYLIGPRQFAVPAIGLVSPFDVLALLLFAGAVVSVSFGAIAIGKQIAIEDQPAEPVQISAAPGE